MSDSPNFPPTPTSTPVNPSPLAQMQSGVDMAQLQQEMAALEGATSAAECGGGGLSSSQDAVVQQLKQLSSSHNDLEDRYDEERRALEEKYEGLYRPLYAQRREALAGEALPGFWLKVMMEDEMLGSVITSKDQECLRFLSDVRYECMEDMMSFRLHFAFRENPYFSNSELTKEYKLEEDDEPILEHTVGCDIAWKPSRNLTVKVMKKKSKGKKGPVKTKTTPTNSFFTFFSPPDIANLEMGDMDEQEEEELQEIVQSDFELGALFREDIIPHAVLYYTGEIDEGDDSDYEPEEGEGDSDDDFGEGEGEGEDGEGEGEGADGEVCGEGVPLATGPQGAAKDEECKNQ